MKTIRYKENTKIRVVSAYEKDNNISTNDAEMDERANQAVSVAINKAMLCKKPIAKYDLDKQKAYMVYPDGRKVYV